jgi:CubicO group peptidase (beta-lactamase class C family)
MSAPGTQLDGVLCEELATWPVGSAGVAVVVDGGDLIARAGADGPFPWASVTKVISTLTILAEVDRGLVRLDEPAGPPGATLRHLLSHASGLSRDSDKLMARPATRRVYSNRGIERAAEHVELRSGQSFTTLLTDRVLTPLRMTRTLLDGSPAHGAHGTVRDLARLASELIRPQRFPPRLVAQATTPVFAGLSGLLPGFGRQEPNDWGLGIEVRGHKSPHWTSPHNAPSTFGHFGQSGSFLWVDPVAGVACVGLSDTAFGPWAADAWPRLSTRVLDVVGDVPRAPDGTATGSDAPTTTETDQEARP